MAKNIQVIVFDLGGVLVELDGIAQLLGWIQEDITPDELWKRWLSSPAVRAFEVGKIDSDVFAQQLIKEMSLLVNPETLIHEFTYWPRGLFPDALELVQHISPEYSLATLSNTNPLHWPRLMNEMGLANIFQHYFASHLIGLLKPDREVYEYIIEALDCEPSSILFIDDNLLNVKAARDIGIQAEVAKGVNGAKTVLIAYDIIS